MTATARSPLHHLADVLDRPNDAVRLRELPFLAQAELRVDPGAAGPLKLPEAGTAVSAVSAEEGTPSGGEERHVLWCGPGWYLVVDPNGSGEALESGLRATLGGAFGSVVDVSAQRTVLELSGPRARAVLAHGCSLDLHPRVFGPGRCAQTNLAQAQVILQQTAPDTYRIFVRVSYADYLARWLLDAMTEYVTGT